MPAPATRKPRTEYDETPPPPFQGRRAFARSAGQVRTIPDGGGVHPGAMTLYERLAATDDGSRALAAARLRRRALRMLHRAHARSGLTLPGLRP